MPKDTWLEIQGKNKRDILYITQFGEKEYHELHAFLIKHYAHLFEKPPVIHSWSKKEE